MGPPSSWKLCTFLIIFASIFGTQSASDPANQNYEIQGTASKIYYYMDLSMPGVRNTVNDSKLCTSMRIAKPGFIVKFTPKASSSRAHHIAIYGCRTPFRTFGYWPCTVLNEICADSVYSYVFVWARNGPDFEFPVDVGYAVGEGQSYIHYLVLQTHYATAFEGDVRDYSGIEVHITAERKTFLAGVYMMGAYDSISIPPHTNWMHVNMSVPLSVNVPLHVFAYRMHTHMQGRIMSAYRFRPSKQSFKFIAKFNPQWPQSFYKTDKVIDLNDEDILAAQCIYENNGAEPIEFGDTGHDEMCILYLYYYTKTHNPYLLDAGFGRPENKKLFHFYPRDADVPLPTKPELEKLAAGTEKPFGIKAEAISFPFEPDEVVDMKLSKLDRNLLYVLRSRKYTTENRALDKMGLKSSECVEVIGLNASSSKTLFNNSGGGHLRSVNLMTVDNENNIWMVDTVMHRLIKFSDKLQKLQVLPLSTLSSTSNFSSLEFLQPKGGNPNSSGVLFTEKESGFVFAFMDENLQLLLTLSVFDASANLLKSYRLNLTMTTQAIMAFDAERRILYTVSGTGINAVLSAISLDGNSAPRPILPDSIFNVSSVAYCDNDDVIFVMAMHRGGYEDEPPHEFRVFVLHAETQTLLYSIGAGEFKFRAPRQLAVTKDCGTIYCLDADAKQLFRLTIRDNLHDDSDNVYESNKQLQQSQKTSPETENIPFPKSLENNNVTPGNNRIIVIVISLSGFVVILSAILLYFFVVVQKGTLGTAGALRQQPGRCGFSRLPTEDPDSDSEEDAEEQEDGWPSSKQIKIAPY